MNCATIVFGLALVASATASITPVTDHQQQQMQQAQAQVQQMQMQQSVMQPMAMSAVLISDIYGRQLYRSYTIQDAIAAQDQKASASDVQGDVAKQGQYSLVQQPIGVNYIPIASGYPQVLNTAVAPLGIGGRLGASISISPAARGFALGGLTGLGVGLASRSLLAGSLVGPIGLGIHSALSTPALGVGLGAGAALLG